MIKKILKSAVILLSAGIIATPAMAAEWGVSGQIRINWDVTKTVESKTANGKSTLTDDNGNPNNPNENLPGDGVKKITPQGIFTPGGDNWVSFDLKGENVNGSLLYYADGRQEFVGKASGKTGSWAANASFTVRDDTAVRNDELPALVGVVDEGVKSGDQTVELVHDSGFAVKAGFTTPLDTFRKGGANLLQGHTGENAHVGDTGGAKLDTMDNRSQVVDFSYKINDSLNVGLTLEQIGSQVDAAGTAFASIGYGKYKNTPNIAAARAAARAAAATPAPDDPANATPNELERNLAVAVAALAAAETALDDADDTLAPLQTTLTAARVALTAAQTALTAAQTALTAARNATTPVPATITAAQTALTAAETALDAAAVVAADAHTAARNARAAVAARTADVAARTAAVAAANSAIDNNTDAARAAARDARDAAIDAAIDDAGNAAAHTAADDNNATKGAPSGFNTGLRANLSAGPLGIGLVIVSGSEAGDADLGGNADYTASASALGLGVGLDLGVIKPYLNLWMPSSTSENDRGSDETTSSTNQIGVDVGPLGLSIVNRSTTHTDKVKAAVAIPGPDGMTAVKAVAAKTTETTYTNSGFELGYNTTVGGAAFKVGYVTVTETKEVGILKDEASVAWLRVRIQHSF